MPIIRIEKKTKYTYAIWKITETLSSLYNQLGLTKNEKKDLEKLTHIKRKKQSIAAKLLLNKVANKKLEVYYNQHGMPMCEYFKNISISHSDDFSAILISNQSTGLDIQKISNKIEIIKTKFLHDTELKYLNKINHKEILHIIWCSKEAIFKTLNGLPCSFKKNIFT